MKQSKFLAVRVSRALGNYRYFSDDIIVERGAGFSPVYSPNIADIRDNLKKWKERV